MKRTELIKKIEVLTEAFELLNNDITALIKLGFKAATVDCWDLPEVEMSINKIIDGNEYIKDMINNKQEL